MQQRSLFKTKYPLTHGGTLSRGKHKGARPLARKRPIHFVLKSRSNLYRNRTLIETEICRLSARFALRIYGIAVAHDHVHFVAMIPGRREYAAFIRSLTGLIARKFGRKIWSLPPFSRIATWGRAYDRLKNYLCQNREEAAGTSPYKPRKSRSLRAAILKPRKSRPHPWGKHIPPISLSKVPSDFPISDKITIV